MNRYFTADLHFCHKNILKFKTMDRNVFSSVEEMNETLISNWNSMIGKRDEIYILGDMFFCSPNYAKAILEKLNGKKFWIRGNHDKNNMVNRLQSYFEFIGHYLELKIDNKTLFILSHYAHRTWNKQSRGSYHLYGHSHGKLENPIKNSMDVGVDTNNFYPYSLEEVLLKLTQTSSFEAFQKINRELYLDNIKREQEHFINSLNKLDESIKAPKFRKVGEESNAVSNESPKFITKNTEGKSDWFLNRFHQLKSDYWKGH